MGGRNLTPPAAALSNRRSFVGGNVWGGVLIPHKKVSSGPGKGPNEEHHTGSMLADIQTPPPPQPEANGRDPSGAITRCLMMEEHVSSPGRDTLSELLLEFTVKPREAQ